MRRFRKASSVARSAREGPESADRAPVPSWRVWLPDRERDGEAGNPCRGIALAVVLSLPIWILLGIVTFVVAV